MENLLEDFAKFKELDMEEMMDVYPLMETLLQVDQTPKGKRSGFDKFEDSEIMRQLEVFRDRLEREEKRRELKDTTPKKRRRKTIPKKEINNNSIEYSTQSSIEKRKVPNFLIEKNIIAENKELLAGLKLVGDFLEKSILRPNNLSFPKNRVSFINSIQ